MVGAELLLKVQKYLMMEYSRALDAVVLQEVFHSGGGIHSTLSSDYAVFLYSPSCKAIILSGYCYLKLN